ncbi:precorrin-6A synthase (deacetylating) [Aquamicrobium sp. LC103]|uniref:precorrin-6A synthase (deacetylating) n=1 Tax=Aquamicrobium sp. LC103 TaxID=1120658 RepID=UPI00063EA64F|nr:precorrin-6A synthase (deacetylating) [Aquamicrobium sp. LC103]TKT80285.1 precorrin-6A synthase (deacetylating) [Aquamicrobium sp. LC103]
MRRQVLVIGIGAGNPEHLTIQAVGALNRADVLFIPNKGDEKEDLAALRREICERYIEKDFRLVEFEVPRRSAAAGYRAGVDEWHGALAAIYDRLLAEELDETQVGAFLVWGDPSLYDSTLRILDRVEAIGRLRLEREVVPGITSVQALTAAHGTVLNNIGEPVVITTGRKLSEGWPQGAGSVAVMLDGEGAFTNVEGDPDVFWGAYLGTPDETIVAGRLSEVGEDIRRLRREKRAEKGWIMDICLLRKG